VGELAQATMSAHLIKTQHKAQDPSNELNLVCKERIGLRPYRNGPNLEIRTVAKGTTIWETLEWSAKRWPITKVVEVKHEPSKIGSWGLIVPLRNHPRTLFGILNKFQGNSQRLWESLGILMNIGMCVKVGR